MNPYPNESRKNTKVRREAMLKVEPELTGGGVSTRIPSVKAPKAAPTVPNKPWKAKTSGRWLCGVKCAKETSSIDLKGPVSSPEGDITPKIAAKRRATNLDSESNTKPEASIMTVPITRTSLRPILSAFQAKMYESTTSPRSVSVMKTPILDSEIPISWRKSVRIWLDKPKSSIRRNTEPQSSQMSVLACFIVLIGCMGRENEN